MDTNLITSLLLQTGDEIIIKKNHKTRTISFFHVFFSFISLNPTSRESFFGSKQARRIGDLLPQSHIPERPSWVALLLTQTLRARINMCMWKRQRLAFGLAGRVLV